MIEPFGAGPVVVGPVVPDLLRRQLSAPPPRRRAPRRPGWQDAPRPVTGDDLLPERAMAGDGHARQQLVEEIYRPLGEPGLGAAGDGLGVPRAGGSIEGTARMLFVHPNTVRYRLRRVTDVTGWSPSDVRPAFTYRIALILGRLTAPDSTTTAS